MNRPLDKTRLESALALISDRLRAVDAPRFGIVVCGGAALLATNLVARTTRDVDVLALLREDGSIADPDPLPPSLLQAAAEVEAYLGLPPNWLNNLPSRGLGGLYRMGLPEGLLGRLHRKGFGTHLTVAFIDRLDQIHLKLYAAVDRGGYHTQDLQALSPASGELEAAAHWAMTHDVSEGFRDGLQKLLSEMGHEDVAARI